MRRSTFQLPLFFLLTVLSSIPFAHASSDLDLTQIPQMLADKTGFPVFACGILISSIIIMIPVLIIGMLAGKSKNAWIGELVVSFSLAGFFVAINWYPVWMLGILCLIVAFAFSEKLARVIIRG